MSENRSMTAGELWDQQNTEASENLDSLAETVTQREWLLITAALDRTRKQIGGDSGLTLAAMAWVKEKREHGGARWDRFLDMTDEELAVFHGYAAGERPADTDKPAGDQVDVDQGQEPANQE